MEEDSEVQEHHLYVGATVEEQAAIGRIAIWAASVEWNLGELCVALINHLDHEVGYAVTSNMSASSMIRLAKKLVTDSEAVAEEERAEVQGLLAAAKTALEQRNMVLHASTGEIRIEGKTVFFHRKKKRPPASVPQPRWESTLRGLAELDEIGAILFRASEDLWEYVNFPA